MPAKRKYRQGPKLSLPQVIKAYTRQEYVFWNHKPVHPSFYCGLPLRALHVACLRGTIRKAIKQ